MNLTTKLKQTKIKPRSLARKVHRLLGRNAQWQSETGTEDEFVSEYRTTTTPLSIHGYRGVLEFISMVDSHAIVLEVQSKVQRVSITIPLPNLHMTTDELEELFIRTP